MASDELTDNSLDSKLGITFDELTAERVTATMPVVGNTQPYGILHGGAICSLVESTASMGAAIAAGLSEKIVMGTQQSTNFLRAVSEGTVQGVATPVYTGRTMHVWNVEITHVETGKVVAVGRVSLAVRDAKK